MEASKLNVILEQHRLWLAGKGGSRANLHGANLTDAYLNCANLRGANLTRAYLKGANLTRAILTNTILPDVS